MPQSMMPTPLPDATRLVAAAWSASHLLSMRSLSERAQHVLSKPQSRQRVLSTPAAMVELAQCGVLLVPFGGLLLESLEIHLRSFVIASAEGQQQQQQAELNSSARAARSVSYGFEHVVSDFAPSNPHALDRAGVHAALVLRTSRRPTRTTRCDAYRLSVWNAYAAWLLGELGVFATVHGAWLSWDTLELSTLVEKCHRLADALRATHSHAPSHIAPNGFIIADSSTADALASQLVGHFKALSRGSGLVASDIKPRDMLVCARAEGTEEEALISRLSDFEVAGTGAKASAGIALDLDPRCALRMNLQTPLHIFMCGPWRRSELARAFVSRSLSALESLGAWRIPSGLCEYDVNSSSSAIHATHYGMSATGVFRWSFRAYATLSSANFAPWQQRDARLSVGELQERMYTAWVGNRSRAVECPTLLTWDRETGAGPPQSKGDTPPVPSGPNGQLNRSAYCADGGISVHNLSSSYDASGASPPQRRRQRSDGESTSQAVLTRPPHQAVLARDMLVEGSGDALVNGRFVPQAVAAHDDGEEAEEEEDATGRGRGHRRDRFLSTRGCELSYLSVGGGGDAYASSGWGWGITCQGSLRYAAAACHEQSPSACAGWCVRKGTGVFPAPSVRIMAK